MKSPRLKRLVIAHSPFIVLKVVTPQGHGIDSFISNILKKPIAYVLKAINILIIYSDVIFCLI